MIDSVQWIAHQPPLLLSAHRKKETAGQTYSYINKD